MNVQVVGLVRFSVLTSRPDHGWRLAQRVGTEGFDRTLFEDARLERRFRLFEALTLPSLDAQTDRDFTVVALTSKLMPRPWLRRLKDLAEDREHMRIMAFEPNAEVPQFARRAIRRLRRPCDRIATFRLDDDDALGRDFVGALRATAQEVPAGTVVSAHRGLKIAAALEGGFAMVPLRKANSAQGLSLVTQGGSDETIFCRGNHSKIDPASVVPIPAARPSWLYALHGSNDSRSGNRAPLNEAKRARLRRLDAEDFVEALGENYPRLRPQAVWEALTA